MRLKLVQQDLGELVLGLRREGFGTQDVVVLDSLIDYLPDRLVAGLLAWCRTHLAQGGMAILTGLAPSPDAGLFDHLLRWPMVRRSERELCGLVEAAGLRPQRWRAGGRAGRGTASMVLLARREPAGEAQV